MDKMKFSGNMGGGMTYHSNLETLQEMSGEFAPVKLNGVMSTEYHDAKNRLISVAGEELANKLIKIIDDESNDVERRTAFLDTTAEEIAHGADYSKCETINDMCKVYANSLTTRLGF